MGRPVIESRVLRGGSWNNNQENARADYRNNNRPDDRNNNIGFRVVCSSHIQPSPFESPTGPAGQGWPDAAGGCWMARAGPVRALESRRRAHSKGAGRRLGQQLRLTPRRLRFILSAGGLADPPTEKTPDFRHHEADVSILPGREPAPLKREAEKETELIQGGVSLRETVAAGLTAARLGLKQEFGKIKGCAEETGGDGGPKCAREVFSLGNEPGEQIESAGEYDEVFHGASSLLLRMA